MKPIVLLLVCLLVGSAAGFGIAWRETAHSHHFGPVTNPEQDWESAPPAEGVPKAVVEGGTSFAFGRMELNTKGSHTFIIRNEGDGPLRLTKQGTTCKCTLSALEDDEVLPGESVEVTLEWHPETYAETFAQTAKIGTNDPENPTIELRISGSIVQAVLLDPRELKLTNLSTGETRQVTTRLLSFKDANLEIEEVSVQGENPQLLQVTHRPLEASELDETDGAVAGHEIQLEVQPGLPLGTNRHTLVVRTSSSDAPEVEIPVTSFLVGDISIIAVRKFDRDRNVLFLNKLKQTEGISTQLFLIVKGPHRDQVTIRPGEKRPDYLQVEVGEGESINEGNVRKFPVTIEVPKGAPAGNFLGPERADLGKISLQVEGHPEIEEVNIGVYFSVE